MLSHDLSAHSCFAALMCNSRCTTIESSTPPQDSQGSKGPGLPDPKHIEELSQEQGCDPGAVDAALDPRQPWRTAQPWEGGAPGAGTRVRVQEVLALLVCWVHPSQGDKGSLGCS